MSGGSFGHDFTPRRPAGGSAYLVTSEGVTLLSPGLRRMFEKPRPPRLVRLTK